MPKLSLKKANVNRAALVPARSDSVIARLSSERRAALAANQPAMQRLPAILKRLSRERIDSGERWSEKRLERMGNVAADIALGKQPAKLVNTGKGKAMPWDGKKPLLEKVRRVALPSGQRVALTSFESDRTGGFKFGAGPYAFVLVKPILPKKQSGGIGRALSYVDGFRDTTKLLGGSIGYAVFKIHRPAKGKPLLIVSNFQMRALPGMPASFRRQCRGWELALVDFLEDAARRAGAGKIAIISADHASLINPAVRDNGELSLDDRVTATDAKREKIREQYERLEGLLKQNGFSRQSLTMDEAIGFKYIPESKVAFLVKELK